MAADDREEQYLLRVQDRGLAQRLSCLLRDDAAARPDDANIELTFDHGAMCFFAADPGWRICC